MARSHILRMKPLPGRMMVQYGANLHRAAASVACTRVSVKTRHAPSLASSMRKFITAFATPGIASPLNCPGVAGLFTIAGRVDAQGCNATQPNFANELSTQNITFRIPTPTFGTGLIESVDKHYNLSR